MPLLALEETYLVSCDSDSIYCGHKDMHGICNNIQIGKFPLAGDEESEQHLVHLGACI